MYVVRTKLVIVVKKHVQNIDGRLLFDDRWSPAFLPDFFIRVKRYYTKMVAPIEQICGNMCLFQRYLQYFVVFFLAVF